LSGPRGSLSWYNSRESKFADRSELAGVWPTMIVQQGSGAARLAVEFGSPPADAPEVLARAERARRNSQWLQAHWDELLPRAAGKFVAVAGAEAFVADSPQEAWAWAGHTHPEDDAATVQYVNPQPGPRIYAHRG